MNYLAHLVLSGPDPQMRTGGFLGDWLNGPLHLHQSKWPDKVLEGVQRHRHIDAWIDQQPETAQAMALLGPRYRRLAGPVIDIAFDHLLCQQFSHWHKQSLSAFCQNVFLQLSPYQPYMPIGAQRFLTRAQAHHLFERYGDITTYHGVVASLQRRLTKPELLNGIEPTLEQQHTAIAALFATVYPKLIKHVDTL